MINPKKVEQLRSTLSQMSQGGNVDLANRQEIPAMEMAKAGYDIGDGYATTYTGTYSNPNGNLAGNFTPIQLQNGRLNRILPADEMQRYAEDVMSGNREDDLGLRIGGSYSGDDAIAQAVSDAERQHRLQELYYNLLRERYESQKGRLGEMY